MKGTPSWSELINKCEMLGLDLAGRHNIYPFKDGVEPYDIYGAGLIDIELDVLTGEKNIRRVELLQDTGASLSPLVDIGQIEGAFTMGLGLWLSEELKSDPDTGRLMTRDTWVI